MSNKLEGKRKCHHCHENISYYAGFCYFCESPTGRRFANNSPKISQEMSVVMESWGEQIGRDFAKKIEERW